ncbi:MAG: hypothetical protein AB1578_06540 [Thermodesulfobacteriota bacterium]
MTLCLALAPWPAAGGWEASGFSHRPVFVDPHLGGWAAPLETLCFQAGGGELYYVAGVFLGEGKTLALVSRSKLTLRQVEQRALQAYAGRLARDLAPSVSAMEGRGMVERVVLLFYATALSGNLLRLELWEAEVPARALAQQGAVALRLAERRAAPALTP